MGKAFAAWLMLAAAAAAPATAPRETVQGAVERVVAALEESSADAGRGARAIAERRRAELRQIARDLFDFDEMSRRTLSRHWSGRSVQEREEFVALFSDLLERSYVGRIEAYAGEKISYTGESIESGYASVKSRIATRRRQEIALDYRLHLREGRWRVYDVLVEGVSFVSTYRSEFNRIIQSSSYGALVERLRQKRLDVSVAADRP